jgi:hypothetical protein
MGTYFYAFAGSHARRRWHNVLYAIDAAQRFLLQLADYAIRHLAIDLCALWLEKNLGVPGDQLPPQVLVQPSSIANADPVLPCRFLGDA